MVVQILSGIHRQQLFFSIKEKASPIGFELVTLCKENYKAPALPSELSRLRFQFFFYKMVSICPDFRSHLKSGLFKTQPLFDHSKSRLQWGFEIRSF